MYDINPYEMMSMVCFIISLMSGLGFWQGLEARMLRGSHNVYLVNRFLYK